MRSSKTKVQLGVKVGQSSGHTRTRFQMFLVLEFWVAPSKMSTVL